MKTKSPKKKNLPNKSILMSTYLFLLLFFGLIGYLIYFNIQDAQTVINNSYNKRQGILAEKVVRGEILSSDDQILAQTTTAADGTEKRTYPFGSLFAHAVGYLNNGGYGLDSSAAYYMLASSDNFIDQIVNDLSGKKNTGDNIVTTLHTALQKAAYDALGSNLGSVVILEPSTGKILAMVSKPDFDPNTLADQWSTIVNNDSGSSVLVNRATQGLYPPGSTFKLVTLLEYLRENPDTYQNYSYTCDGTYELTSGKTIDCLNKTAHGVQDTKLSLAHSCNCSFINMGLSLKIPSYIKTANELLFNQKLPLTMEYKQSQFVLNTKSTEWDIAQTSFGQGQTLITPMHLAMIGSTIANGGELMTPYLVDHVENASGKTIKTFKPESYGKLMTKNEASIITEDMGAVIDTSFGWLYNGTGYDLAAKSGTAQYGTNGYEHSLFVSFSPRKNPEIVVACVVEGGTQRNTTAAEVVKKIYDAYYALKKTK